MNGQNDRRLDYMATRRNGAPILQVLNRVLPKAGRVLEIGSGSGQHITMFAPALPGLSWQASDPDPRCRASIDAWGQHEGLDLPPAIDLDAARRPWPPPVDRDVAAVIAVNMIHVAPWDSCLGLLDGAAQVLDEGGLLYLYGPFAVGGQHSADSNVRFDASLRAQNPEWGIRNLDDVALEARARGLHLVETVAMPANNLSVIFNKRAGLA